MPLAVAPYLARRFDQRTMNCWHVARDAWYDLTGEDLGDRTPEAISRASLIDRVEREAATFEAVAKPVDPCLVLMQANGAIPHVGVYTRGRVLQITERGCTFAPLHAATHGFPKVTFYRCRST